MVKLFRWGKSAPTTPSPPIESEATLATVEVTPVADIPITEKTPELAISASPPQKNGFFSRLRSGLTRTRQSFGSGVARLFLGKKEIDEELLEALEAQLLSADVGVAVTTEIMAHLAQKVARKQLSDVDALRDALKGHLRSLLLPCEQPLIVKKQTQPFVILMVGINGSGKTTTIGKLAKLLQGEGKKVLLAAGDTFRAAAIEQLQAWGERNNVPVIAQKQGADTASVIYDAFQGAKARGMDVLIADTAGRLHTQQGLMEELKKVKRVIQKLDPTAPHETLLVLDAGIGQNALIQAQQFHQAMGVTGLVLTKLDGTAKGGILFAIAGVTGLPIRFIGLGEGIDDLRAFSADEFVDALFVEGEDA